MRDRNEKSDVAYEAPMVMAISKHDHKEDVRHNAEQKQFFPKKKDDTQSEKSRAFQKKWGI